MLISLDGRRVHYDLVGPAAGPVVCLLHALSADGGVWVESAAVSGFDWIACEWQCRRQWQ